MGRARDNKKGRVIQVCSLMSVRSPAQMTQLLRRLTDLGYTVVLK